MKQPDSVGNSDGASKALLNTYIHNYLIGEGLTDLAKALRSSNRLMFKQEHMWNKDSTDGDNKDDASNRGEGGLPGGAGSENFLPSWWSIFWDMWSASRRKERSDTATAQYLEHTQVWPLRSGNV